jgi:hypothetical protein
MCGRDCETCPGRRVKDVLTPSPSTPNDWLRDDKLENTAVRGGIQPKTFQQMMDLHKL